jgi:hypothetical protein
MISKVKQVNVTASANKKLNEDVNVLLARKAWKQCHLYLKRHGLTISEAFREMDWDNRGLINEHKFTEWTKRHVGIASRSAVRERLALWAFLVNASGVATSASMQSKQQGGGEEGEEQNSAGAKLPLEIEGEDIRMALLTAQDFQMSVSRLLMVPEPLGDSFKHRESFSSL